MGILDRWITHRARIVGLSWPLGVAEVSGVASATLEAMVSTGGLRGIGRSARGYVARSLKVSVRELEALAAGRIQWIEDSHVIDLDRRSAQSMHAELPGAGASACPRGQGVPILGRVLANGDVEQFDDWTSEEGSRLLVRYKGVPGAFSLECENGALMGPDRRCLVFQVIPPGEVGDGELVLLTRGDRDGASELRIVQHQAPMRLRLLSGARGPQAETGVSLCDVLRAARMIGWHRPEDARN